MSAGGSLWIARAFHVAKQLALPTGARMTLIALGERSDPEGRSWPGLVTLARDTGLSPRTQHSMVHELCRRGLVRIGKRGRGLQYTLTLPASGAASGNGYGGRHLQTLQESSAEPDPISTAPDPRHLQPLQENSCTTCNPTLATIATESLTESPTESPSTELRSAPATPIARKPPDVRSELFGEGLAIYRGLSGVPDGSARKALGALLREARDDCARVLAALRNAADVRPADPFPFLRASLQSAGLSRHEQIRQEAGFGSFLTGDVPPEWLQ